ncbi:MAG: phosphoenolpyruvate--protein phosphotransferase [Planctomycetes bacterium]|nr:phosphoenolpyruvate--protein phosphotransferase [Planctomycetota bacterium]
MDQIKLLCDIGELNHLFRDSVSVENILQRIVELVTHHIKSDVCSIWLYDEDVDELVLRATKGLSQDAVNHVKMKLGEGLAGTALKELRPIALTKATSHPDYKLFIGTGEEQYDNFLVIPISRGITRIGVLVLRRKKRTKFTKEDTLACKAVASQLANIVENARFLMAMHSPQEKKEQPVSTHEPVFIRGKSASEGFAFSTSKIIDKQKTLASLLDRDFTEQYLLSDFEKAVAETEQQLEDLQKRVEEKLSDAASLIFASHLMILKDKEFVGAMSILIDSGTNPPVAVLKVARKFLDIFSASTHDYVREKVQDVEDLVFRIMGNLLGEQEDIGRYGNRIIIASEIFPSELLRMSSEGVSGIILVSGGVTSHLSILSRSLQIPMVISNDPQLLRVKRKTPILIDAEGGNVYINPTEEVSEKFINRNEDRKKAHLEKKDIKPETFTKDGIKINLFANINLLSDLKLANEMHCGGVGLYRTEFPFIIRRDFPSEQEQYVTYRKLIEQMKDKPVLIRTLDIGGDKALSYYRNAAEQNPSMGMRSIRFSLLNKTVFSKQIRAILRAGIGAELRIMFPMISSIDEFIEARQVVRHCSEVMTSEGTEHNSKPKMGIMVELPSVVDLMEEFACQADFFSIGTNDFIQFMLGVDRTNEKVESFYLPHHPSVLRGIQRVVSTAIKHGKDVSLCGDMAHDDKFTAFLLGIGMKTFSVDASFAPKIQKTINAIDMSEANQLAEEILSKSRISEVAEILKIKS